MILQRSSFIFAQSTLFNSAMTLVSLSRIHFHSKTRIMGFKSFIWKAFYSLFSIIDWGSWKLKGWWQMENFDTLSMKISSPIKTVMGMILIIDTQILEDGTTCTTFSSVPLVLFLPWWNAKFQHQNLSISRVFFHNIILSPQNKGGC